jgi:hypothetical protein
MRPTQTELLETVRHSLREVVLPAVDDDWARYVAKCMDKLLVAVQVRMEKELAHLAHDTAETAGLMARLRTDLTGLPGGEPALEALREAVGSASAVADLDPAVVEGLPARVGMANVASRVELAGLVDLLYAAQATDLTDDARATVVAAHEVVRAQLRRQLARDVELMAPTFMAFGDPARVSGTTAELPA